ncbi:uncharacterized protein LOC105699294 [Orussus abietinus]|uniref:uncharacterized protein LOC105699294 n=1 Tax=Orussus abietinus TaxID=222816 RepID=UPI000C715C85|nr:uncharacterized protein LOC105699294 [Orussus abietinus]
MLPLSLVCFPLFVVSLTSLVAGLLHRGLGRANLDGNPDALLTTPELATKYGFPLEIHRVVTEDGYVLELHRIPRGRRSAILKRGSGIPVLLQHGLAGSSADWIIMGPENGLAYILADRGYDVWLGNNRGNVYSRNHTVISPTDKNFWDFSFHELGVYDLPATIDHIIDITGFGRVLFVGHSQGTTQFLVMASQRPEYNFKVDLMVGLAPAAYTSNLRGPITKLAKLTYFGVWVGERFGYPELGSRSNWGKFVSNLFCQNSAPTQFLCTNFFFLMTGYNQEELNLMNLTVIIGHVPAGASWKQLVHFGQGHINPGYFRLFDYANEEKNVQLYGSAVPPEYPLERISTPVALFGSDEDRLATTEDVARLVSRLNHVVADVKVPAFNHYDFIWGRTAPRMVFEPLIRILETYRYSLTDLIIRDWDKMGNRPWFLFLIGLFNMVSINQMELIDKYGYNGETHLVTTRDGYILELHRITGTKKNPDPSGKTVVFVMHGLLGSSADWILSRPGRALAFLLADAGYDVWLGNARGNKYSRRHRYLSLSDKSYWSFSWHEIGIYDLPKFIDYALDTTGQKDLIFVGFSQGTTVFYVMMSELPIYNTRIRAMFSLAPVGYMENMISPFFKFLAIFVDQIELLTKIIGFLEFAPTDELLKEFALKLCDESAITQPICTNIFFIMSGFSCDQMDKSLLPVILSHVPAGASAKQVVHYGQLIKSGYFRQYDYGFFGNLKRYHSISPPDYNLFRVRVPVTVYFSHGDWLSHPKDVEKLYFELRNPKGKNPVPHSTFNHVDFMWAKDAKKLVYDHLLKSLGEIRTPGLRFLETNRTIPLIIDKDSS